jgi:hypothetical protein
VRSAGEDSPAGARRCGADATPRFAASLPTLSDAPIPAADSSASPPAVMLAVLAAVLVPQAGRDYPVTWCIAGGERAGSDAVRNLLLFVPLGMAAAGWFRRPVLAAIACAALSLAVETAQIRIPGRDPALGDFIFNSIGGAIGVALARAAWLHLSDRRAGRLALGWAALVWAAVAGTGWLLAPAPWSPRIALAEREGGDLVLRVHTRAEALNLDQPVLRWRGAVHDIAPRPDERFLARRTSPRWCIDAGLRRRCGIGPTAGSGWGMIIFPDGIARRFGALVDAAWVALLFLPLGFWLRRSRISLAAIAIASLAALPATGLMARTTVPEWAGAVVGIGMGMVLRGVERRWRDRVWPG